MSTVPATAIENLQPKNECKQHHKDKLREYYQLNVILMYIVNLFIGDMNKKYQKNKFSCERNFFHFNMNFILVTGNLFLLQEIKFVTGNVFLWQEIYSCDRMFILVTGILFL
jgi:hypothetical protein